MYAIETYKDLESEIDIAKIKISSLKDQKKILEVGLKPPGELGCQQYSDMPHGSKDFTSIDRLIPRINKIDIQIEREELILKIKSRELLLMNVKLKGLTGIQYQVCRMREIDNLNYIQISQRLNINERTARRIMDKINKENQL